MGPRPSPRGASRPRASRWPIDKLAVGLSFSVLGAPVSTLAIIVAVQAFVATLLGLFLGKRLGEQAGGIAEIVAGLVFSILGLIILYQTITLRA